jgi:hypothetical protein
MNVANPAVVVAAVPVALCHRSSPGLDDVPNRAELDARHQLNEEERTLPREHHHQQLQHKCRIVLRAHFVAGDEKEQIQRRELPENAASDEPHRGQQRRDGGGRHDAEHRLRELPTNRSGVSSWRENRTRSMRSTQPGMRTSGIVMAPGEVSPVVHRRTRRGEIVVRVHGQPEHEVREHGAPDAHDQRRDPQHEAGRGEGDPPRLRPDRATMKRPAITAAHPGASRRSRPRTPREVGVFM